MAYNNQFPIIIQTHRGNIPIDKLNIGDIVYGYNSGEELEIKGLTNRDEDIYIVKYNDGRISYYSKGELEYLKSMVISQYTIEYNRKKIVNPLYPDPYIAGALLVYGDQNDKYLNLPFDIPSVNNLFAHKYQLNYGSKVSSDGKKYFRYNGDPIDKLITWEEFFPNYRFVGNPGNCEHPPLIPLEYHRASISDRLKFIRGVFDMGYNRKLFPEDCGISHTSNAPLVDVQKILWSVGMLSMTEYDQKVSCDMEIESLVTDVSELKNVGGNVRADVQFRLPLTYEGRDYRLYVLGKHSQYPGLFYNIETIEDMIRSDYKHEYLKFRLQIKSIKVCTKTKVSNILLDKSHLVYLTDNFLPKISGKK